MLTRGFSFFMLIVRFLCIQYLESPNWKYILFLYLLGRKRKINNYYGKREKKNQNIVNPKFVFLNQKTNHLWKKTLIQLIIM